MEKNDYIFGIRPVLEAIEAAKSIDKILIKRELTGDLAREVIAKAKEYDIPVQRVPNEKLNRITMKNHQGVIAIMCPVRYQDLDNIVAQLYEEGKVPLSIILDGVTDARNFGAIARSAECAGADFIVIPERGSASVTSDAVRASAGALFHIPVCRVKELNTAIGRLKENGYKIVGASEKSAENYTDIDYNLPVALVMGAEDTGISNEVLRRCDDLAAIPIKGKVGSLNVSVACGVMLYEAVRQRSLSE
ncbi:MAG: 23S rRNA (guanosine(2251)-2'-O)-methyltransferase RlmB [Muribaculaceae bacterium]|nr:23S rRNA (guanosine(2251)-2'-O)-methyltransferase RlmB [Muribaculaceae bacterium]